MPDLHGWITQQIDRIEALAREQENSLWQVALGGDSVAAAVLRRCAADRNILAQHQPQPDGTGFPDSLQCRTCSKDGGDGYQYLVPAPCPTLHALAEAYRWEEKPDA